MDDEYDDDRPMFCDETGEALNEAAKRLVLDALAADKHTLDANDGVAPTLGPILSSIPVVECAEGTHKYVQVQLTHPNEPGAALLVVRSYASCNYHAVGLCKLNSFDAWIERRQMVFINF